MTRTPDVQAVFESLYREHWGDTVARARRHLRGRADAADVAATAFTRLWAEMQDGRVDGLLTRLNTLTDRSAWAVEIRARRERKRLGVATADGGFKAMTGLDPGVLAPDIARFTNGVDLTPELAMFRTEFDALLRALPPKEREAFTLTELRGLSSQEAADVLGVPKSTTYKRAARARESIANALIEGGVT